MLIRPGECPALSATRCNLHGIVDGGNPLRNYKGGAARIMIGAQQPLWKPGASLGKTNLLKWFCITDRKSPFPLRAKVHPLKCVHMVRIIRFQCLNEALAATVISATLLRGLRLPLSLAMLQGLLLISKLCLSIESLNLKFPICGTLSHERDI
jgi:hypothetical protein